MNQEITLTNRDTAKATIEPEVLTLADELFRSHRRSICQRTDRLFAGLMVFQWAAAILAAVIISPRTWIGVRSETHIHIWAAIILGGLITSLPVTLALVCPGRLATRCVIAVAQMLSSALLIHVSGGRIETHFHVFGSLAFLSFYRDWRVLVPATIVVAADHFFRGVFYPESVYGVIGSAQWRFLEHASWVVFEDIFLIAACLRGTIEMRQIALRTAEMTHAREAAEAARQTAEAANRAKSEFLANMSHEIRTPLNGVVGMVDLLAAGNLNERQQRHAQIAKASADSLLSLINAILDFSKIEAGKVELVSTEFDLGLTVESVVEMLAERAHRKGIELAAHVDPRVRPLLRGDEDRLRQILVNLINNAIKFTERGHVIVRVTRELEDTLSKSVTVRFEVTDSGIGIPKDRMDRLFKSFSQVDASTTRKYGGTGLGLAISKQLAVLMGGDMGVHSVPQQGSTFWFTIKLGRCANSGSSVKSPSIDPRALRVLVVDENAAHRNVVVEQLSSWGFRSEQADTGRSAMESMLKAIRSGYPFDVLIVDSAMAELCSKALADEVSSKQGSAPLLPAILILTGMREEQSVSQLNQKGFCGYITKPVRQSTLFDTIMNGMKQARSCSVQLAQDPAKDLTQLQPLGARSSDRRLLLVEDNDVNQMVAVEVLSSAGYQVQVASNGKLGVQAALSGSFDLILMDCQMPEMDGFEATAAIRAREQELGGKLSERAEGRIPIIALTANALSGDRERCLKAGMDEYLTKPIDAAAMLQTIGTLLASTSTLPPAPPTSKHDKEQTIEASPIDTAGLLRRCVNKSTAAARILDTFGAQSGRYLNAITTALRENNMEEAQRAAHTLKGASTSISAEEVGRAAAVVEQAIKAGEASTQQFEASLAQLKIELDRCLAYLPTAKINLSRYDPGLAKAEMGTSSKTELA